MKTIFVTGAAGFIGSHVCEYYLHQKFRVIGIDNFDPFYSKEIKRNNLSVFNDHPQFLFYEIDIRDGDAINKILAENQIDYVIHLAAKAGVRCSIESVEEYFDVNVNGTISILQAMKKNKVTKLLFASSSSIYGNNKKVPFSESDSVDNPISPYAASKKSGELICHVYAHLYKFDITCLRFFTVYGPRQRPDLAIHKFTRLIDEEMRIPFYGDGNSARDYTYINDIVNGINCALDHLKGYNVYNLGESKVISLRTVVETIEKNIGGKAVLEMLPMQKGDVNSTFADISKAKFEIGYDPKYDFESGMKEFIDWYDLNKSFEATDSEN